jgi:MoaA/NifB/PqqE/SkfB family radical SAM enzyme
MFQTETSGERERTAIIWMELTGRCQLECIHCYANSGPHGAAGGMKLTDWKRALDEAAEMGANFVQFIGGEPTLHHDLPELVKYALNNEIEVEIFTNLAHCPASIWEMFRRRGVRLATSYYSADASIHDQITRVPGSHAKTTRNIAEAIRSGIPLRVGIIAMNAEQNVQEAARFLRGLGVSELGLDYMRRVGLCVVSVEVHEKGNPT